MYKNNFTPKYYKNNKTKSSFIYTRIKLENNVWQILTNKLVVNSWVLRWEIHLEINDKVFDWISVILTQTNKRTKNDNRSNRQNKRE